MRDRKYNAGDNNIDYEVLKSDKDVMKEDKRKDLSDKVKPPKITFGSPMVKILRAIRTKDKNYRKD